jgi:hypothetical protein
MNKKSLILGASSNPQRYAYAAANRLDQAGIEFEMVSNKQDQLLGKTIHKQPEFFEGIHTVTLYLNPTRQEAYYDYILSLKPKRVIFNPGTENPELESLLEENHIEATEACTLVLLSIGKY